MKIFLLIGLIGATWQWESEIDQQQHPAEIMFSATLVPIVQLTFNEHWRGNEGIAEGTYMNTGTQERYAFAVPITHDHPTILVPDGLDGMNQEIGVAYVSLQDIGTPVAMGD